jgi:hypothetical protein
MVAVGIAPAGTAVGTVEVGVAPAGAAAGPGIAGPGTAVGAGIAGGGVAGQPTPAAGVIPITVMVMATHTGMD